MAKRWDFVPAYAFFALAKRWDFVPAYASFALAKRWDFVPAYASARYGRGGVAAGRRSVKIAHSGGPIFS